MYLNSLYRPEQGYHGKQEDIKHGYPANFSGNRDKYNATSAQQGYPQTQGYPQSQGYPQAQGYPQQGYPPPGYGAPGITFLPPPIDQMSGPLLTVLCLPSQNPMPHPIVNLHALQ